MLGWNACSTIEMNRLALPMCVCDAFWPLMCNVPLYLISNAKTEYGCLDQLTYVNFYPSLLYVDVNVSMACNLQYQLDLNPGVGLNRCRSDKNFLLT